MSKEKYSVVETENAYYIADNDEDVLLNVAVVVNRLNNYEHGLSNCIEPKFVVGQEIWEIKPLMSWKIKRIEWHKFNGGNGDVVVEIYRLGHDGTDDYNCCIMPVDNDRFFATEAEARKKLGEIGNETNNKN